MYPLLAAAIAAATPLCALSAGTLSADPASLASQLERARPGDRIVLLSGDYGDVTLPRRSNAPGIFVDARAANLRSLMIRQTTGWVWYGGKVTGDMPPKQTFDVVIDAAKRIEIRGVTISGGKVGVSVTRGSQDITLRSNTATGVQSDGFDIAGSQRVALINSRCLNFKPIMPVYDAGGKLLQDGSHADCIQIWSIDKMPLTSDITITGTVARGYMQGIGQYKSWGAIRNLQVTNNDIRIDFWNGIAFSNVDGLNLRGNHVRATPGARAMKYPYQAIRTRILATGARLGACGNITEDMPGGFGTAPC